MGKIDLPAQPATQSTTTDTKAGGFPEFSPSKILSYASESVKVADSPTDSALELIGLKRVFGMDAMDEKYNGDIKGILEIGKAQGLKENEIFEKVREIRYKLGAHDDKSVARQVYQYLKMDSQIKQLVRKQRMIEHV
jgi:hypothetical protein